MLNNALEKISSNLHQSGYQTQINPSIPGVMARLYAYSPSAFGLGFAKVEDHFIFIDWENPACQRLDLLLETYLSFSKFVNTGFPIPHALRIRIPNLVICLLSFIGFTAEINDFSQNTYLTPWYGGETGQLILLDLKNKITIHHKTPKFRSQGSLPLQHAVDVISKLFSN